MDYYQRFCFEIVLQKQVIQEVKGFWIVIMIPSDLNKPRNLNSEIKLTYGLNRWTGKSDL